jgi:two-component system sensor histidine kinase KdpD
MGWQSASLAVPDNSDLERVEGVRPANKLLTRKLVECLAGGIIALAVTYAAFRLHITLPAVACLYLLIVVLAALRWGFREATIATVAAFLSLDYFFTDPLFSLRVEGSANWIALGVFEFTGLVVSHLSARARQQERIAIEERRHVTRLYELSRSVLLIDPQEQAGQQVARFVQHAIDVESVAIFDPASARTDEAGIADPAVRDLARNAWLQDADSAGDIEHAFARVLRVGGARIGAVAMRGKNLNSPVADAVASIAAIAFERSRALKNEARAEAARQSERLRTAVLDALAHAFKTPLTAIRVASSGLLEIGSLDPPEAELVELIDNESAHLTDLANRLLQTARLDDANVPIRREECRISTLIDDVLERLPAGFGGHGIEVEMPNRDARIRGNGELIVVALLQLVDNACKYSTPGSSVTIAARSEAQEVVISVHNRGPAIGLDDRQCIFERFYRASGAESVAPGTGLGLSITRRVAEAHGGHTWVVSDEKDGTTFFFALPACPSGLP